MFILIRFLLIIFIFVNLQATDNEFDIEDLEKPLLGVGPQIPFKDVKKALLLLTKPKKLKAFAKENQYILEKACFFNFIKSLSRDLNIGHKLRIKRGKNKIMGNLVKGKYKEAVLLKSLLNPVNPYEIILLNGRSKLVTSHNYKINKSFYKTPEAYFLRKPNDNNKKLCYIDNRGQFIVSHIENIHQNSLIPSEVRPLCLPLMEVLNPPLNIISLSEIEKIIHVADVF